MITYEYSLAPTAGLERIAAVSNQTQRASAVRAFSAEINIRSMAGWEFVEIKSVPQERRGWRRLTGPTFKEFLVFRRAVRVARTTVTPVMIDGDMAVSVTMAAGSARRTVRQRDLIDAVRDGRRRLTPQPGPVADRLAAVPV